MVGDLRLLSQGDTGRLVVDLSDVDLAVLALDVYEEMRPAAEAREIQLRLDAPRTLNLVADQQRLRQLLMILIDNALQYTPAGGHISVAVRRHERRAVLTVQDVGSRIEPRHLPPIFDRFYRGDAARTQHPGGTGLALAIAREIVEAHGAQIAVQSRPGAGTAFRLVSCVSQWRLVAGTRIPGRAEWRLWAAPISGRPIPCGAHRYVSAYSGDTTILVDVP